jgi:hypothetical protein
MVGWKQAREQKISKTDHQSVDNQQYDAMAT